ncbi:MAG: recombination-associated protein RdgC [Burkholderiales bacterium]|nr:recombination-associated protein RdgC [Burkholderiales bacterium]
MFKNLMLYAIGAELPTSAATLADELSLHPFAPCAPTQPASTGWVPPRGAEHGALVEAVNGHWIAAAMTETRLLPEEVIKRRVAEMAAEIERQTGRKPGKRQRRELKDQATLELLPAAFTRRKTTKVWIDPSEKLLAVDASSQTGADAAISLLIAAWPKMNLHPLKVHHFVDSTMGTWLIEGAPDRFYIDREAVLENAESHAVIRYQHTTLDAPDVRDHIISGKVPTRLALTFDARVSFVLVDDLRLQRIELADGVFMEQREDAAADRFDADVAIATGELSPLIRALVAELGGRAPLPIEEAAAAMENLTREHGTTATLSTATGDTVITFGTGDDPMYEEARKVVVKQGKASISLVQRYLQVGYNRAARLLESLEKAGVVSAMNTDGHRKVLQAA